MEELKIKLLFLDGGWCGAFCNYRNREESAFRNGMQGA